MAKAIKATQKKVGSLENTNQQQKRVFFDLALKAKNALPPNHSNKVVLVSMIYDEFL
jgi:hypothetical protein